MTKQEQINMLQFRIERIESHLAEQHKGNNFNLSEKPNSSDHYIPQPGEVVEVGDLNGRLLHRIFVKYDDFSEYPFVCVPKSNENKYRNGEKYRKVDYKLCRRLSGEIIEFGCDKAIQYHVAVHEAVTIADEPIKVAEYYQPLFDLLHKEHNVIATQSELDEIIRTAGGLDKPQHKCKYCGVMTSQPDDQCYKNPYAVDWSNAPEEADTHAFDKSGKGWFYGLSLNDKVWYADNVGRSPFTLPTGLDWKQSKTSRP